MKHMTVVHSGCIMLFDSSAVPTQTKWTALSSQNGIFAQCTASVYIAPESIASGTSGTSGTSFTSFTPQSTGETYDFYDFLEQGAPFNMNMDEMLETMQNAGQYEQTDENDETSSGDDDYSENALYDSDGVELVECLEDANDGEGSSQDSSQDSSEDSSEDNCELTDFTIFEKELHSLFEMQKQINRIDELGRLINSLKPICKIHRDRLQSLRSMIYCRRSTTQHLSANGIMALIQQFRAEEIEYAELKSLYWKMCNELIDCQAELFDMNPGIYQAGTRHVWIDFL